MQNLTSLLERFSRSLNKDAYLKEIVLEVIKSRVGVSLPPDSIAIKDGVLGITASPVVKSEISLKESLILKELSLRSVGVSKVLYK